MQKAGQLGQNKLKQCVYCHQIHEKLGYCFRFSIISTKFNEFEKKLSCDWIVLHAFQQIKKYNQIQEVWFGNVKKTVEFKIMMISISLFHHIVMVFYSSLFNIIIVINYGLDQGFSTFWYSRTPKSGL